MDCAIDWNMVSIDVGARKPSFTRVKVVCPYYCCGHVEGDEDCMQCPVADDCEELTRAPQVIEQILNPALLPPYLASRFELVRKLAINKLGELLHEV